MFEYRLAARTEAQRIKTAQAVYDATAVAIVPPASVTLPVDYMDAPLDPRQVRLELERMHSRMDQILALVLAPKDGNRTLLTLDALGVIQSASWQYPSWRILDSGWNESVILSRVTSKKIQADDYTLTIPYDSHWGNDKFGVQPSERVRYVSGNGTGAVAFGPILGVENELGGPTRLAEFVRMPKRTEAEAIDDQESWITKENCSESRRATTDDFVRIGSFRALKLQKDYCEGGLVTIYEVFGQKGNYQFSSATPTFDDVVIRWTIERFKEK